MRLVFDTNVLIAAFIAKGICINIVEHCLLVHYCILSDFIIEELEEKLTRKFKYSSLKTFEVINLLTSRMHIIKPSVLKNPVSRDPDDDIILGTAIAGDANCIVTGDKDLLILKKFKSIKILSPREFIEYEENLNNQYLIDINSIFVDEYT
jgi:putative PIN family toxin of toxin-antitoxin system